MSRVDEIRARWEQATTGPWSVNGPHEHCGEIWVIAEGVKVGTVYPDHPFPDDGYIIATGLDDDPQNAEAIAAAPTDIAYLLSLAEALARLVATEPYQIPNHGDGWFCFACGEHDTKPHAPDCPWRQARELLGGAEVEA